MQSFDVTLQILVHETKEQRRGLLAIPMREQLESVLKYMLNEDEFLSPYGIRSLSKVSVDLLPDLCQT